MKAASYILFSIFILFGNGLLAQAKVSNQNSKSETSKSKSASKIYERGGKNVTVSSLEEINSKNREYYIARYMNSYVYSVISVDQAPKKASDVSFYSIKEVNGRFDKPQKFELNAPEKLIPVAVSFDKNGSNMFITCVQPSVTLKYTIYQAKYTNGKWSNWTELPVARKMESSGFPVMDESGSRLYFCGQAKATVRGYDIYSVENTKNGWQDAKNIGADINSDGDDMFPTFYKSNLFFSSNDKGGEGKFDIIFTDLSDKSFTCFNSGVLLNTEANDQMMLLNSDNSTGILINDSNSAGKSDLYKFKVEGAYITK